MCSDTDCVGVSLYVLHSSAQPGILRGLPEKTSKKDHNHFDPIHSEMSNKIINSMTVFFNGLHTLQ